MARNKYPGFCYCCGAYTPPGYGHFERYSGGWLVKCVTCASGRVLTDKNPGVIKAKYQGNSATKGQNNTIPRCDKCDCLEKRKRRDGQGIESWCPQVQRDVKQSVFGRNSPRDCPGRAAFKVLREEVARYETHCIC